MLAEISFCSGRRRDQYLLGQGRLAMDKPTFLLLKMVVPLGTAVGEMPWNVLRAL